jgi:hypothetical protein
MLYTIKLLKFSKFFGPKKEKRNLGLGQTWKKHNCPETGNIRAKYNKFKAFRPNFYPPCSYMYVCNRGDTILCSRRAPANKRKLGQFPLKDFMWQLHMKMKQVFISYNDCCCVPGPVNKLAIFGSRKNRTNCVTDHTKGLVITYSGKQ